MYLTGLHVIGLRGAEEFEARSLGRVVELPAGPPGVAVADALSLFAAGLDSRRTLATSVALGLARAEADVQLLIEDGFPTQVSLPEGPGVAALLPEDGSRNVRIQVEVELDPPLYGKLRGLAVRDPRLVTALGAGARVTTKVGWLFTNDLRVASITVLSLAVGDTSFPLTGSDRPSWLGDLLRDLGSRFGRLAAEVRADDVARRLLGAQLSQDPERRRRFQRAATACEQPPFELGRLELVRDGERVEACFGPSLLRARQFGPAAGEALRLVEAVLVDAPDVLIVEAPGTGLRDLKALRGWLDGHVDGERATLEQVIVAPCGAAEPPGDAA